MAPSLSRSVLYVRVNCANQCSEYIFKVNYVVLSAFRLPSIKDRKFCILIIVEKCIRKYNFLNPIIIFYFLTKQKLLFKIEII